VAEALARVRDPDLPPALAGQVFVVRPPTQTPTGRYLGVAHFQRLLRELPGAPLASTIDTDLDALAPSLPTRRVAEYLATYDLLCAPVCDEQSRLLGAVSIDDVLDHLLPSAWRRGPVRARGNGGDGNAHGNGGGHGNGGAVDEPGGTEPMEQVG
jgi:Mg/Co/Ni transporter MgtE